MGNELLRSKERILAIDALRGFAVMGIILLHNIEHFNYYSFPKTDSPLLASLDKHLWDMLFFLFSGKAYAIFALLFGFTFYLQNYNCEKRGEDFRNRYMWRLVLLLGFGFINASFFPGEILVLYALLGFVLVPVRHLSDKTVMWIAFFLMLQPLEWVKVVYALICPEANPQQMSLSNRVAIHDRYVIRSERTIPLNRRKPRTSNGVLVTDRFLRIALCGFTLLLERFHLLANRESISKSLHGNHLELMV